MGKRSMLHIPNTLVSIFVSILEDERLSFVWVLFLPPFVSTTWGDKSTVSEISNTLTENSVKKNATVIR